ncbi:polysaccharide deacetylase family protein [Flavobacterium sp. GSP14]|uniref:polysaccharide deacetylase family protein n=1 Tax=Flavobacterium sp. GSP14 TaxID=3401734 RepID=UPI003AAAC45A
MKFYWIKTSWIVKQIFSHYTWDVSNVKKDKTVYLTFDDGPIPEITPWVLKELKKHQVHATFFCIGNNIEKNPEIFQTIISEGHTIGNHTYNHLNGWKNTTASYLANVALCEETIQKNSNHHLESTLFRPPYGKIKAAQSRRLRAMGYTIIMWDVLSADFDANVSQEQCLANVLSNIRPGSILVFHDSLKAFKNLEYALPKTLMYLKENNFTCGVL